MGQVPLERALSKLGILSRSQTRALIEKGRLAVDGQIIRDPDFLVIPEKAHFAIDGKAIAKTTEHTIMLYKPKGYVTTRSDEKSRQTVYDLLPANLKHLHSVGRLDMATTGLLLMTTDTQLSNYLTDPANAIPRIYAVSVKGKISDEEIERLTEGIKDEEEILKAKSVVLRKASNKESHLILELTEGKNREIRRMFEILGSEVIALKRIAFGKLKLGDLESGKFREITKSEI